VLETPSTRVRTSGALLEGLAAGLVLGGADLSASAPWRLPPVLWLAALGLGALLGFAGGGLGALFRRPGLPTAVVLVGGLALEVGSVASKELAGTPRLVALGLGGVSALATLVLVPSTLARLRLFARVATPLLVPATALLRPVLDAPPMLAAASSLLIPAVLVGVGRHPTRALALAGLAVLVPLPAWRLAGATTHLERPGPAVPATTDGRPDVVLLVVDTLRADAPAPRGALADLASEGVRFGQCISAAPWTLPAVASLLTGLLPSQHGAVSATTPLSGDVTTLAERLAAAGYATAAFTGGAFVGAAHGLDQGFELFDSGRERRFPASHVHEPLVWRLAKNRYWPLIALVRAVDERRGLRGVVPGVVEFARRHADRPRFLFLHTYQVHDYYLYDPDTDDDVAAGLSPRFAGRMTVHPAELATASQVDLDGFRARYDARVAAVEACLADLRTALGECLTPDAVWIVTSDHGEGFDAARGRVHHGGRLHDDLLHVPLVVRAPGRLPAGTRVEAQVRSVDLVPTLLDLLGLPALEEPAGQSLLPALRGERPYPPVAHAQELEHGLHLLAARSARWKLVRDDASVTLFDLAQDPEEPADAGQTAPPELERALETFEERFPPRATGTSELDRNTLQHLRELGYVE
jgi:arylsulfatase